MFILVCMSVAVRPSCLRWRSTVLVLRDSWCAMLRVSGHLPFLRLARMSVLMRFRVWVVCWLRLVRAFCRAWSAFVRACMMVGVVLLVSQRCVLVVCAPFLPACESFLRSFGVSCRRTVPSVFSW